MRLARLVVRLVDVAPDGDAEREPPHGRDHERDADAVELADADVLAEQHDDEAHDERRARPDVAPRVPLRRHLVVAVLLGGVDEERVVEHERGVQHDRRDDIDDEKHHRVARHAHDGERHRTRADGAGEELLLVPLKVGDAAQKRHEQREHERGYRGRIAPRDDRGRIRVGNGGEVDGDERRGEQHVGRIPHIIEHPTAFGFRHLRARHASTFLPIENKLPVQSVLLS